MKLGTYFRLITFEHTIFALPFALASLIFAYRSGPLVQEPTVFTIIFVLLCAVSARTAAMAFNRVIDLRFDKENPRTHLRELVVGEVSRAGAIFLVFLSSVLFLLFSAAIGTHCLVLAPFVLAYLFFYSYSKRFTEFSHLILGGALALAPGGAWWVLRPQLELTPLILMAAVIFWVGGFDIIYSTQDEEFDRSKGLHSIPAKIGIKRALLVAKIFHAIALLLLFSLSYVLNLSAAYSWGLMPILGMFLYQHSLVSPQDLSRVNRAFFTVNGWVSVYFFLLVLVAGK